MRARHICQFALAALFLLGAAACSSDSKSSTTTTSTTTTTTTTTTLAAGGTLNDLSPGEKLIAQGAMQQGVPESTAVCIGKTAYARLTPEQQAEITNDAQTGQQPSAELTTTLTNYGTEAFGTCSAAN